MFITVIDECLKNKLIAEKYNLIKEKKDINNKTIWVFEDTSNRFCFDIKNEEIRKKCFVSDKLTITF